MPRTSKGASLSQSPGLSFRLEQGENVSLSDGSLDVPDDLTRSFSQKLNLHLGALTLGSGAAENLDHASQRNLLVHLVRRGFRIYAEIAKSQLLAFDAEGKSDEETYVSAKLQTTKYYRHRNRQEQTRQTDKNPFN